MKPPPLPPPLPPPIPRPLGVPNDADSTTARICGLAAIGQCLLVFAGAVEFVEVYHWKDHEHALHFAAMTLGLAALYWLVVMGALAMLIGYVAIGAACLLRASVVFLSPEKAALRKRWATAACFMLPFGLVAGLYAIRDLHRSKSDR